MNNSPSFLNSISQIKEDKNTVFLKVDDGIYEVIKDRLGNFSGRLYVSTNEVIDELNSNTDVAILGKSVIGSPSLIHQH